MIGYVIFTYHMFSLYLLCGQIIYFSYCDFPQFCSMFYTDFVLSSEAKLTGPDLITRVINIVDDLSWAARFSELQNKYNLVLLKIKIIQTSIS